MLFGAIKSLSVLGIKISILDIEASVPTSILDIKANCSRKYEGRCLYVEASMS